MKYKIGNSKKIFESVLNERDEVQYPTTATFKSGKPKKIPTLLKYIFDNPGCTKKEAEAYLATLGLNRLPLESWPSLERTDMVESIKQGSVNKYFPTKKLLTYLKSLNLIDNNADISDFNDAKNNAKEYKSGKVKQYQQGLYKKIIDVINNDSPGEYDGWMDSNTFKSNLTNNQIIEVLNKVVDNLS